MVGLSAHAQHRALELSGGEQQQVALARALIHKPRFIVADEPIEKLDLLTGRLITKLLRDIVQQTGVGLLVVTHDAMVAEAADRILRIHDGVIT